MQPRFGKILELLKHSIRFLQKTIFITPTPENTFYTLFYNSYSENFSLILKFVLISKHNHAVWSQFLRFINVFKIYSKLFLLKF